MTMNYDTFAELRDQNNPGGSFDGSEPFMTNGHQILSKRQGDKRIPEWAQPSNLKELIQREFPRWKTDQKQRDRAGRWHHVIYQYYYVGDSASDVAQEMGLTLDQFKNILRCIRRVAVGRRCDNRKAKGLTPRGRMKGSKVIRNATGQHVIKPVEHDPIQLSSGITELVENDPFKTSLGRGITSPGAVTPSHPGGAYAAPPSF
jgi:hypothetical protein